MKDNQKGFIVLSLIVLIFLIGTGVAWAQSASVLRANVGTGGGTVATNNIQLRSNISPPLAGTVRSSSTGLTLCVGFVCGASQPQSPGEATTNIYLPYVAKTAR